MDYQEYVGFEKQEANGVEDYWLENLESKGYFVIPNVLEEGLVKKLQVAIEKVWKGQLEKYGEELLRKIGDYGVARGMMCEDPLFFDPLTLPIVDKILSLTVGSTSILHLQNGICLYPDEKHNQGKFHKDFAKDFMTDKLLSINIFFPLDPFNSETGGTWLVPGSHKFKKMPSAQYIEENKVQLVADPGCVLVFDSLLWHCAGLNKTKNVRRAINHQYTRPFIKQQLNYPMMLEGKVDKESKLAQRLGMWAISPYDVDTYRVTDPSLRTYRAGQG